MRILLAAHGAQFRLYRHIPGHFHHAARKPYIFLKRQLGTVNHHGGISLADAVAGQVKAVPMVQMQCDGNRRGRGQTAYHSGKKHRISIFERAGRGLNHHRSPHLFRRHDDGLRHLHVFDVECANGISSSAGPYKHFSGIHKRHNASSLSIKRSFSLCAPCATGEFPLPRGHPYPAYQSQEHGPRWAQYPRYRPPPPLRRA